ncbi:MAG: DASS family sodium-coupled anion symporter [Deltaproteobacteria bacterium]
MSVEIDTRPIWVLVALKALRPLFFIALALGFYWLITIEPPHGLSAAGLKAIAVFAVCLVLWVTNALPLAVTSILAMVLVPLFGILPGKETYALFGNEAVFFILGAFILAGAVMHSGLSTRIALTIMDRFGASPRRLLLSVYLLAATLSFFMSEHAVAAMLFPIVLEVAKSLGLKPGKSNYGKLLFLSLAWGCIIGGIGTFLGGARVPLAVGILKEISGATIGFLEYSVAVFPLVVIMLFVGYFMLTRFFPMDVVDVQGSHAMLGRRLKGLGKVSGVEYATGAVLCATIAAWMVIGRHGLSVVALSSVVVLFVLRLVKWKDVEEYVNWGIILMYGGAIVLGTALDSSGAANWMIDALVGRWAGNPIAVFAALSLLAILLTEAMSNAAVIAVLVPVSVSLSGTLGISPTILTYSIAVPAGLAFMLPMSTPANAIVVSSNYVSVKEMARAGGIMVLISWVVFNLVAYLYWPLIGLGR